MTIHGLVRTSRALAICCLAACGGGSSPTTPSADLLTNRYDNGRTSHVVVPGLNGPAVAAGRWGRLGTLPADGAIYAQPLFTHATRMADGRAHDVVYVATARNKVYAYDAATLALLWSVSLPDPDRLDETLRAPFSPLFPSPCTVMSPTWLEPVPLGRREVGIGIQSTPVIDRKSGLLYVSY